MPSSSLLVIGGCSNAGETTSKKIGVIGAMEEEVNSLKEALTDTKTSTIAGMEFSCGRNSRRNQTKK